LLGEVGAFAIEEAVEDGVGEAEMPEVTEGDFDLGEGWHCGG